MPKAQQKRVATTAPSRGFTNPFPLPEQKIAWLKIASAVALLASFGLSWRLWISTRAFPLAPVSSALPAIPFPIDYVCFVAMIGLLVAIAIVRRPQKLIFIFLAIAVLLAFFDQNRWQPWFYQSLFMFLALAFYGWKRPESALNALRLIAIATYFWSGCQKLNAEFIHQTWPDMAGPLLSYLPFLRHLPPALLLFMPVVEIAIGIGLLTRKFRNLATILAVATHLFILLTLITSGENRVVWPWNVAMILVVWILFWQDADTAPRQVLGGSGLQLAILLFFGILPALSFAGLWDSYLSVALYSGNTSQAVIYVSPAVIERLPPSARPHVWQSTQPYFLDINRWSYGELNVPLYPEPRIYRRVAEDVCDLAGGDSGDVRLRIKGKPNPLTGVRKSEFYDCAHLDMVP